MRRNGNRIRVMLGVMLVVPIGLLVAQQTSSLAIDGQPGQAKVIQVQGKNYVDVDGLARITGGALRFSGNQIVLALPGGGGDAGQSQGSQPAQQAPPQQYYSKQFLNAGIEAMTQVREWHAALRNAIERGYPLSEDWLGAFKRQVQTTLRQAQVAMSTDMDQQVFPFLQNEFNNMAALSDKYLKKTANLDYIAPNSLANDQLDQKLLTCGKSLALMVSSNAFIDDGSCQ